MNLLTFNPAPVAKSKWWIGSLDNPRNIPLYHLYVVLDCDYLTGQLATGLFGRPTYNFVAYFSNPVRIYELEKKLPYVDFELCRSPMNAIAYARQETDRLAQPKTFGTCPLRVFPVGDTFTIATSSDSSMSQSVDWESQGDPSYLAKWVLSQEIVRSYVTDSNDSRYIPTPDPPLNPSPLRPTRSRSVSEYSAVFSIPSHRDRRWSQERGHSTDSSHHIE